MVFDAVKGIFRLVAGAGFLLTMVGAGFVFLLASLIDWELALVAAVAGSIALTVAIYGLVVCSRTAVHVGAVAQLVGVLVVLAVALPAANLEQSEGDRRFMSLAILVLLFDLGVFLGSWALPRRRRMPSH